MQSNLIELRKGINTLKLFDHDSLEITLGAVCTPLVVKVTAPEMLHLNFEINQMHFPSNPTPTFWQILDSNLSFILRVCWFSVGFNHMCGNPSGDITDNNYEFETIYLNHYDFFEHDRHFRNMFFFKAYKQLSNINFRGN